MKQSCVCECCAELILNVNSEKKEKNLQKKNVTNDFIQ